MIHEQSRGGYKIGQRTGRNQWVYEDGKPVLTMVLGWEYIEAPEGLKDGVHGVIVRRK